MNELWFWDYNNFMFHLYLFKRTLSVYRFRHKTKWDFIRFLSSFFSTFFFFFSSTKKTKLNKANRELSKCQFSRASLEGLGPRGQHINTFLITKGKLSQFNIQFHCHVESFFAGVQECLEIYWFFWVLSCRI